MAFWQQHESRGLQSGKYFAAFPDNLTGKVHDILKVCAAVSDQSDKPSHVGWFPCVYCTEEWLAD
jgi:hypothetical protein